MSETKAEAAEPEVRRVGRVIISLIVAGLLALAGLFAFCVLLSEGAVNDWAAVYLHGELGAGHTVTALYEIEPVDSPSPLVDKLKYAPVAPQWPAPGAAAQDQSPSVHRRRPAGPGAVRRQGEPVPDGRCRRARP